MSGEISDSVESFPQIPLCSMIFETEQHNPYSISDRYAVRESASCRKGTILQSFCTTNRTWQSETLNPLPSDRRQDPIMVPTSQSLKVIKGEAWGIKEGFQAIVLPNGEGLISGCGRSSRG
jgi:hypothetical protein